MEWFATAALLGWGPASVFLFSALPARRAVVTAAIAAWLFLPVTAIPLPALPDLTKATVPMLGLLAGALIFDAGRLAAFRPRWWDLPIACWCLAPFVASLANGLGYHDAISALLNHAITWGIPYFLGRTYLNSLEGLRELALGVVIGGLIYVPFCLLEMRISPQTHRLVYGTSPSAFSQSIRYGGYRPQVFMAHGLELGMWMTSASLAGWYLWSCGALKRIGRVRFGALPLPALLVTTLLCKSTGSLTLLAVGAVTLRSPRWLRSGALIWALAAVAPVYCGVRTAGLWGGREAVVFFSSWAGEERGKSLEFRLTNEDMLITKALQRPLFGWGGWGRSRIFDERGRDISVTDGLWIIALGCYGVFGLASLTALTVGPALRLAARSRAECWAEPELAPAALFAVVLTLFAIDNLSNAMFNPIFLLAAGGLMALPPLPRRFAAPRQAVGVGPARRLRWAVEAGLRAEGEWDAIARGEVTEGRGRQAEAELAWALAGDAILTVVRQRPMDHGGRAALAFCLEERARYLARLGDYQQTATTRREALGLRASLAADDHSDVEAALRWADSLNDLAWVLAAAPDQAEHGTGLSARLAARAVEQCPLRPAYWNTLAAALCRKGDHAGAVEAARRAVALGGAAGGSYQLVLALAYLQAGDRPRGLQAYRLTPQARADENPMLALLRAEVRERLRDDGHVHEGEALRSGEPGA